MRGLKAERVFWLPPSQDWRQQQRERSLSSSFSTLLHLRLNSRENKHTQPLSTWGDERMSENARKLLWNDIHTYAPTPRESRYDTQSSSDELFQPFSGKWIENVEAVDYACRYRGGDADDVRNKIYTSLMYFILFPSLAARLYFAALPHSTRIFIVDKIKEHKHVGIRLMTCITNESNNKVFHTRKALESFRATTNNNRVWKGFFSLTQLTLNFRMILHFIASLWITYGNEDLMRDVREEQCGWKVCVSDAKQKFMN